MGSKLTKVKKNGNKPNSEVLEKIEEDNESKSNIQSEPVIEETIMNEEDVLNDQTNNSMTNENILLNTEENTNDEVNQNLDDHENFQINDIQTDLLNQDIISSDFESNSTKENDFIRKNADQVMIRPLQIKKFVMSPRNSFAKISFVD